MDWGGDRGDREFSVMGGHSGPVWKGRKGRGKEEEANRSQDKLGGAVGGNSSRVSSLFGPETS